MNLLKPITVIGAIAVAGVSASLLIGCGNTPRPTADEISDAISTLPTGAVITETSYADLREMYADSHKTDEEADTTGFNAYLWGELEGLGYDPSTISVLIPAEATDAPAVNLPVQIAFYLDNSSSMKGYLNPGNGMTITGFVDVINGIKSFYNNNEADSAFYVSAKGLKGTDFNTFASTLTSKKTGYSDAFLLDEFLGKIATDAVNDTAHNRIAFFITDGIPSGTNAEIARDRNFNKNNRTTLENRISSAVNKASGKNYGASVYQFNANFDGDYYDFANGRKRISKGVRPFYVVVLGEQSLVKKFADNADSNNIRNFSPLHSVHMISPAGELAPTVSDLDTDASTADRFVIKPEDEEKTKTTVNLQFPFEQFPDYMRDEAALRSAFRVTMDGVDFPAERLIFQGNSVVIPVPMEINSQKKVDIDVLNTLPGWIAETTTDDDADIMSQTDRTFFLDVLVNGLRDGVYRINTNNLAHRTFTIDWDFAE